VTDLRDFLTVDRDAVKIKMLRSTHSGTFLLVEGSSDKTFYERFIDKLACQLFVSTAGKKRAIETLAILKKSNFQGILAIVDADFDRLQDELSANPNLLRTDTHDLETMLINSPALDKVVAEFGSEEKINKFNRDIRTVLLEAGMPVGYLLWISECDGLSLTFEGIKFSKFIDENTLQIDELKLIREVKNKSQALSLKDEDLQQQLMSKKSQNRNPWQVCCGHHLVEILSFSLLKTFGSNKHTDVESNSLERSLRLAYEEVFFLKTELYSEIRRWERNNEPFKVLRKEI
jgi:Protein of unknown function (DUF4435)